MHEPDDGALREQFESAYQQATSALAQLDELAEVDALDGAWSSHVTRCKTAITDHVHECKRVLSELQILASEWAGVDSGEELRATNEERSRLLTALEQRNAAAVRALARASARESARRRAALVSGAKSPMTITQASSSQQLVSASRNITEGLRRTTRMMAEELELSQGNLSVIAASTHKLGHADKEYRDQAAKLRQSKQLLRKIWWQDHREDVLLYTGVSFFALCVAYIAWRRSMLFVPAFMDPSWWWAWEIFGSSTSQE